MGANTRLPASRPDPDPYILLNPVRFTLAALQAPVINDYQIGLKAELEIRKGRQCLTRNGSQAVTHPDYGGFAIIAFPSDSMGLHPPPTPGPELLSGKKVKL